ncbi:porin family protein [Hydrogenimonas cancrithermarum]|uniref:Attachment invasion locus protein n=1 Tax=Hydrogenimonas cancrithermarum TaxID=2993563 RepID=A0ABM8FKI0_9BACT|nr:porin family protein [Hydrogenimonas cancrithermarum]BDY11838.1 attachment invasion locus protein [Hydrogenimonas cancrithermarum]
MKKSTLAFSMLCILSTVANAGDGNVEREETMSARTAQTRPFYVGIGVGQGFVYDDTTDEEMKSRTLLLQAGYQYNRYFALEGRYTYGFTMSYDPGRTNNSSSDYDGDFWSWGIYLKPSYPIDRFSLYALLGYGGVMLESLEGGDAYESGFQWGVGAAYSISENLSFFADYVRLYDDTGFDYRAKLDDVKSDTWAVGLSYKF